METIYLVCAALGGTILVCQFVMTVMGLAGDGAAFDGVMVDMDVPGGADFVGEGHGHVVDHGSTWLFSVISFRTLIAAITFFGIAGMGGRSGGLAAWSVFALALVCAVMAMFVVHWLMKGLVKLNHDGTLRIERSVGFRGTVYVPIPGDKAGEGKIQIRLQNRIVELKAITGDPDKLQTGAKVVIRSIVTPTTVEVALITDDDQAARKAEGDMSATS